MLEIRFVKNGYVISPYFDSRSSPDFKKLYVAESLETAIVILREIMEQKIASDALEALKGGE